MLAKEEIKEKYEQKAGSYDWLMGPLNALALNALRRELLRHASGKVLEVAAGTGKNFESYPQGIQLTATDLSPAMLEVAKQRAKTLKINVEFHVMDAEKLNFPDESFDTVVSALSLCTFPDPIAALKEMKRVCKPDGKLLLLEHGKSSWKLVSTFQDGFAGNYTRIVGCQWNREPDSLVEEARLKITKLKRSLLWNILPNRSEPKSRRK